MTSTATTAATGLRAVEWRRTTSADGTNIAYRVDGPTDSLTKAGRVRAGRTAVVLCNGICCDETYYTHVWGPLAEDVPVVRWHYRAHGLSDPPADLGRIHVRDTVDDLRAVLAAAGVRRAVLVGHSYGVQVVCQAAQDLRDEVAGIVCVAGAAGHPVGTFGPFNPAKHLFDIARLPLEANAGRTALSAFLRSPLAFPFTRLAVFAGPQASRQDMERWFDHLAGCDMCVLLRMMRGMQEHSAVPGLDTVTVPTSVLQGTLDWTSPRFHATRIVDAIDGAVLVDVPSATHVLPIEAPDLVIEETRRVLAEAG